MIFERFYRAADARTMPGSGLGLSIVKQAAERHGGSVAVRNRDPHGAVFTMVLPGDPAPTSGSVPPDLIEISGHDLSGLSASRRTLGS
jgi:two-component system sensor histidine kinase MprB